MNFGEYFKDKNLDIYQLILMTNLKTRNSDIIK